MVNKKRYCKYCKALIKNSYINQKFCSSKCQRAFYNHSPKLEPIKDKCSCGRKAVAFWHGKPVCAICFYNKKPHTPGGRGNSKK